ncbi:hypothetical protein FQA39_LY15331 [Lamprigera yunnana]|nr:hypothetical protein FQA39_LY15331 [Lamprigera yunnana]
MSSIDKLDFTTKNVINELLRELKSKGIFTSDSFVIYYVQLLMLNPVWGIARENLPIRNDVQIFVKHCIQKLEVMANPSIIVLRMQLYFQNNFENLQSMIETNRNELKTLLLPLEKEILSENYEKELQENACAIEKLYQKIVFLITLNSGLGNPSIDAVYKEAEAALRSIFTENDLIEFTKEIPDNKELQILELTDLVTGIRLFNRDCKKGGVGIEDLPKILTNALEATVDDINQTLALVMENIYSLTTALDQCYIIEETEDGYSLLEELPPNVTNKDLDYVRDILIMYRQQELFVKKVLAEICDIDKKSKEIYNELEKALIDVHETVQFKIAIPTVHIFAFFLRVSHIWRQLQDQIIVLSQLNQILSHIQMQVNQITMNKKLVEKLLGSMGPITDADRLEQTTGLQLPTCTNVTILQPEHISNFDEIKLEYLGFCAWKFIETNGGLIPGNPNMGIAKVFDKYYVFSSIEAAIAFDIDPTRYILRALELVRQKPELINLLHLEEQLIKVCNVEKLIVEIPQVTLMLNAEMQTELHPVPSNIDPTYKWNIWDLKRQAIHLSNLSQCATKSSQTIKSRAFEASRTQTYDLKDATQQTLQDNHTNVPKLSNFIFGLRGRCDNNQHIIGLTRPVAEYLLQPKCSGIKLKDILDKKIKQNKKSEKS